MTARTVPTLPSPVAGQKMRASYLTQLSNYAAFWANRPMFRMVQRTSQSIATSTDVQITCDTSKFDTDSGRMSLTPFSYIVPNGMGGRWRIVWGVAWKINTTGARDSYIRINGNRFTDSPSAEGAPSTDFTQYMGSSLLVLSAGDVITLWAWQNNGGAVSTTASTDPTNTFFEGTFESLASP